MERIRISGPSITQREIDYVCDAAATAWYAEANKYHERFEVALAEYVGREFAVALPSCTSAIHLSLLALGVGAGDEVVVPDVTWIASAAPISYVGATPVFADIDEKTWCLSADSLAECITERTRAVIPVDLYGGVPDFDSVISVAEAQSVHVIEDSAEAIGTEYKGSRAGSFGKASVFSFHGSKTLTTGEGGALVSDDQALIDKALFLRDHGRLPGDRMFFNAEIAYKYKMSSLQAAMGLAQVERAEELVARKRQIFEWYRERLGALGGVKLNWEPENTRNTYWMVTVVLDEELGLNKSELMDLMDRAGIDTRPFFHPLSSIPAYSSMKQAAAARERNVVSYKLAPFGLNLPSGLDMTEEKVDYVCQAFARIVENGA